MITGRGGAIGDCTRSEAASGPTSVLPGRENAGSATDAGFRPGPKDARVVPLEFLPGERLAATVRV